MSPQKKKSTHGTTGYPEVEALIDSENFDDINEALARAYDRLSEISRKKVGLKRSRDAKKAMKALELTMELFRELLTIKYQLQERLAKQGKEKPLK